MVGLFPGPGWTGCGPNGFKARQDPGFGPETVGEAPVPTGSLDAGIGDVTWGPQRILCQNVPSVVVPAQFYSSSEAVNTGETRRAVTATPPGL